MKYHDCKHDCGETGCPAPLKISDTSSYDREVFKSSIQSLKAKWWELWLAILFGKRCIGRDSGMVVTMYFFRGKYYLTDTKKDT